MKTLSVAIAGCGPCGLATGTLLARAGHRVTIHERFVEPRPIGSGLMLQPTGLAVLDRLGLAQRAVAAGARIDRLHGQSGGRIVLDVHYAAMRRAGLFGVGIHRSTLFELLHEAAREAGVAFATGHEIVGSTLAGERRRLDFAGHASSEPFDLVVDATGTRSVLAPPTGRMLSYGALWASLSADPADGFDGAALEQRYRRASRMVGVMPMGRGLAPGGKAQVALFWSLRADAIEGWRGKGLDAWREEVTELWPACAPLLQRIRQPDDLTFARYAHRTLRANVGPALIHLGDAWHSASPQLGQGANMALLDAWALTRAMASHATLPEALRAASRYRADHVDLYQWLTALFTPVYQSDGAAIPWLRDRVIGPVSRLRAANQLQAHLVSGLFGTSLERLGLQPPVDLQGGAMPG